MEKVDSACGRERERLVAGPSLRTYNSIPREDLPRISHTILPSRFPSERKLRAPLAHILPQGMVNDDGATIG